MINPNQDEVLEEEMEEDYEPNDEEIKEYAEYLGFHFPEDEKYLYLAKEGLKAPLPKSWKPCRRKNNSNPEGAEIYYYNFDTGESKWEHPCDEHYKMLFTQLKNEETKTKKKEKAKTSIPMLSVPSYNANKKEVLVLELEFKKRREEYIKIKEEELQGLNTAISMSFNNKERDTKKYRDHLMSKISNDKLNITTERVAKLKLLKEQTEKESNANIEQAKKQCGFTLSASLENKQQSIISQIDSTEHTKTSTIIDEINNEIELMRKREKEMLSKITNNKAAHESNTKAEMLKIQEQYRKLLETYQENSTSRLNGIISNMKKENKLDKQADVQKERIKNELTLQMQSKLEEYSALKYLQLKQDKQTYESVKMDAFRKEEAMSANSTLSEKSKIDSNVLHEKNEQLSKAKIQKIEITQDSQRKIEMHKSIKESEQTQSNISYEETKKLEFETREMEFGKLTTEIKSLNQLTEQANTIKLQNIDKKQSLQSIKQQIDGIKARQKQTQKNNEGLSISIKTNNRSALINEIINLEKILSDLDKSVSDQTNPLQYANLNKPKKYRERSHRDEYINAESEFYGLIRYVEKEKEDVKHKLIDIHQAQKQSKYITKQLHNQRAKELRNPNKELRANYMANTESKLCFLDKENDEINDKFEHLRNREKKLINIEARLMGYQKMLETNTDSWILNEHAEEIVRAKEEYLDIKDKGAYSKQDIYRKTTSAVKGRFPAVEFSSPRHDSSFSLYNDLALLKRKEEQHRVMHNKKSRINQESLLRTHMENMKLVESIQKQLNNYVI